MNGEDTRLAPRSFEILEPAGAGGNEKAGVDRSYGHGFLLRARAQRALIGPGTVARATAVNSTVSNNTAKSVKVDFLMAATSFCHLRCCSLEEG